ncbi:spore gernimation protein GerPF [Mesobacillus campisalis]|uniref:Spore gernimation protein GerPF n=1 Tax=Mesobacillus campisalis TaxID=1408103 RepID=A0A0M2SRX1_9BACI|nr:spore germination protein [Mesobacillus campisalis]KKK36436.1 spore gernimation protein GerPF [Mesobacillus campisalis]
MPAFVGPVQIINVGGGNVQFGDSLIISPKSNSKSTSGQGAANTGGFIVTNNGLNANNVVDSNLVDQPTIGNN